MPIKKIFLSSIVLPVAAFSWVWSSEEPSLWKIQQILVDKQYVDLTHEFAPGIPHCPGFPDETRKTIYWYEKRPNIMGTGFFSELYTHVGQWGTHVDPPAHFIKGLRTVDQIDLKEMSRWIHMRPPLADMRIEFGEETRSHDIRTLLVPVNCFACFIGKPRPVRDSWCELVRQVHILFAGKNLLNFPKRWFLAAPYRRKCCDGQDNTQQEDLLNGHLALLKHLRLRSQYLRITLNKSRPCSKKPKLSMFHADVINSSSRW